MHSKPPRGTQQRGTMQAVGMPPLGEMGYLLEMTAEAGIYELTWESLNAWKQATLTPVTAWEAAAMRRISSAYMEGLCNFEGKDAAPPWHDGTIDRPMVADKVRSALRGQQRGRS